ncbi:MAG TPA: DMT family transporter [Candidatus Limnocylindrales bacterium]
MPRDRTLVSGTLAAVVAASLFGMLGPLARFGAEAGVEGVAFASWRATLGVAFLAILIVARGRGRASVVALRGLDRRGRVTLGIAALTGLVLNAAIFTAFERIPIALALMLFYTYPAGVVVVAALLGRETVTPSRVAALVLSTTGVVLVLAGGMGAGGGAPIDPVGVLLGLGAAASQVVFITISRDGYRSAPADAAMTVILAVSMIGGALLAVAVGQADSLVAPLRSLAPWPIVLVAGILAAGLASLLFLTAIRLIGGARTGILMLFEPVVGVILAGLLLSESLAPVQLLGCALVLAGALVLQVRSAPDQTPLVEEGAGPVI